VNSIFSEKYHTTIGVKIDRKALTVGAQEVRLMIWDLAGEDEFGSVDMTFLRGASGYLLVIDGTRRSTLERALAIQQRSVEKLGPVPFIALVNKADLAGEWELGEEDFQALHALGWTVHQTSARTGACVEEAFQSLAEAMVKQP
jgi:small GTP-binding protein